MAQITPPNDPIATNKLHALMDGSPIPCALNNEKGEITFLNKSFIQTLGYTLTDIPDLEHWWPKAYPNEKYREHVLADWNERLHHSKTTGSAFEGVELDIRCKDGEFRTFIVGASELENNFENEHLVTLFDITDHIKLETQQREKDYNYQTLFESSEVSIWNEDLSEVLSIVNNLKKDKSIESISEYLKENINFTYQLANKIKVTNVNNASLRMFEVTDKDIFLNNIQDSFGKNAIEVFIEEVVAIYNGDDSFRSEANYISFSGKKISTIITFPIPKTLESAKCVPISILDITELKNKESELHYHGKILNSIAEGVYFVGAADGLIKFSNSRFNEIFGYRENELIDKHVSIVNAPSNNPKEKVREIINHLEKHGSWRGEVKNVKKNGEEFWCKASVSSFSHEQYGPIWISIHEDISIQKKNESIIWHQANYDSVCNLPNRHLFSDRIEQEIKHSERKSTGFSILFIDLDNFKEINDTLGHDIGDKLLIEVSKRINSCIRSSDIVSRFGGDEFTVLLSDTKNVNDIESICSNIQKVISHDYEIDNETVYTSASIGISSYPHDSKDAITLLKFADQAMYLAKDTGKNCISYFTKDLQVLAEKNRALNLDLRKALELNQFEVFYQPILNLKTGNIEKAEALIRWNHPERGFVSPEKFIPLAEKNKLIIPIGDWVYNEVMKSNKELRKIHPTFQININKSPVQIQDPKSDTQNWINLLKKHCLPGNSICIEITEGLLLEKSDLVKRKLNHLTQENIHFALDDFGTGYSSLAYLTKFTLNYIKIDRSFITNIDKDPEELTLCRAIINMAHSLGKLVVAEGVETTQQKQLLEASNCDYVQGYLFYKPLPFPRLKEVLMNNEF